MLHLSDRSRGAPRTRAVLLRLYPGRRRRPSMRRSRRGQLSICTRRTSPVCAPTRRAHTYSALPNLAPAASPLSQACSEPDGPPSPRPPSHEAHSILLPPHKETLTLLPLPRPSQGEGTYAHLFHLLPALRVHAPLVRCSHARGPWALGRSELPAQSSLRRVEAAAAHLLRPLRHPVVSLLRFQRPAN